MPEIFFTSDTHFGHANILQHCARPFASVDEMDEEMVARWNAVVGLHDDVYHLGDFAYRMKPEAIQRVFRRLRGRKHLIVGNHDDKHVLRLPWSSEPKDRRAVKVPGETLPVILDHYALRTWAKSHHGAIHLFGHSHGALPGMGRSIDVGVDCWDFRPVTLAELRPVLERQHDELERQREANRLFRERAARGDPAVALEILRHVPDVAPEPGDDPLGYDTSDQGYLRTMAKDTLADRDEQDADAEADRVSRLLGLREARSKGRIVSDPNILGGQPHVAGTTVLVSDILATLDEGRLDFEVLALLELPDDAVDAVREWAAGR